MLNYNCCLQFLKCLFCYWWYVGVIMMHCRLVVVLRDIDVLIIWCSEVSRELYVHIVQYIFLL